MARKFFYVAAGMLMLALSYHFGFSTASAQAPGNPVVATLGHPIGAGLEQPWAITASGDVYINANGQGNSWALAGNIFGGGPTPARQETWGQVKSRYAPSRGQAQPGADNR